MKVPLERVVTGQGRIAFYLNGLFIGEVYSVPFQSYFLFHCLGIHNDRRFLLEHEAEDALITQVQNWWDSITENSDLDRSRVNLQYDEVQVKAGISRAEQEEELGKLFRNLTYAINSIRTEDEYAMSRLYGERDAFRQCLIDSYGISPRVLSA